MPDNKSLNILLTTKYQGKGLDDLKKDFKDNKIELDKLTKSGQQNTDAFKKLQLQQKELDGTIKGLTRQYKGLDAEVKASKFQMLEFGENLTVVSAGLIAAAQPLINFTTKAITLGAELDVLRGIFKGSSQDIEDFKTAVGGTETEAALIKMSNRASDLGFTLEQQKALFSLAEDAADAYGGSVESNVDKIIDSLSKNGKGLEQLGISSKEFNVRMTEVKNSYEDLGQEMTIEEELQYKFKLAMELSGKSLDEWKSKMPDAKDKLDALKVKAEEVQTAFGQGVVTAFTNTDSAMQKLFAPITAMTGQVIKLTDVAKILGEVMFQNIFVTLEKIYNIIESHGGIEIFKMGMGIGGGDRNPFLNAQFGGGAFGAMNGVRNLFPGKPIQQQQFAGQAVGDIKKNFEEFDIIINNVTNSLGNFFGVLASGGNSEEGFKTMLKSIANTFITFVQSLILAAAAAMSGKAIATFGFSLFIDLPLLAAAWATLEVAKGYISGLATGGQAHEGQPYIVGEQGKELFIPSQSGSVMNNLDLKSLLSSQGNSNTNNVYISSEIDFIKFYKTSKANYSNYMNLKIL